MNLRETRALALFLVLLFALAGGAAAHEVRPPIATIETLGQGRLAVELTLNLEAAMAGIATEHADTSQSPAAKQYDRLRALAPGALRAELDRFAPDLLERLALTAAGRPVPLVVTAAEIPEAGDLALPRVSRLSLEGRLPPGAAALEWRADPRLGNSVVRLRERGAEKVAAAEYVRAGNTSAPLALASPEPLPGWRVFGRYVEVGFTHIVPEGLDHILFVVGLFLLSARLSALLWQVTAFTLAHTLTLGLSMAGVVELPPSVVEPLIAASIVYVAVENIATDRLHAWRPVVVFAFGLLHGLGFAGILQEIGPAPGQFLLSLVAFNLGVELGQLAVIALCFLVFGWTARQRWHRRAVVVPASFVIAAVAAFWVWERLA